MTKITSDSLASRLERPNPNAYKDSDFEKCVKCGCVVFSGELWPGELCGNCYQKTEMERPQIGDHVYFEHGYFFNTYGTLVAIDNEWAIVKADGYGHEMRWHLRDVALAKPWRNYNE